MTSTTKIIWATAFFALVAFVGLLSSIQANAFECPADTSFWCGKPALGFLTIASAVLAAAGATIAIADALRQRR